MVYADFRQIYNSVINTNTFGPHDFADIMCAITGAGFGFASTCLIVTAYIFNPINCFVPVGPSGQKFANYVNEYCWLRGTIPLMDKEMLPDTEELWSHYDKYRRIAYYQWMPLLFGFHSVLFLVPQLVWPWLSSYLYGGDVSSLLDRAQTSTSTNPTETSSEIQTSAETLHTWTESKAIWDEIHVSQSRSHRCSWFYKITKGKRLFIGFLTMRIFMIFVAFAHLVLFQNLLGYTTHGSLGETSLNLGSLIGGNKALQSTNQTRAVGFNFGITLIYYLFNGYDWPDTMIFPRVSICRIPNIRLVGTSTSYIAQCSLPVNMMAEKLYIFFWFLLVLLIIMYLWSCFSWSICLFLSKNREITISRLLDVHGESFESPNSFIHDHMGVDGVFISLIFENICGVIFTTDMLVLWYASFRSCHPSLQTAGDSTSLHEDDSEKQKLLTDFEKRAQLTENVRGT